uniref:Zinc finger, CCCH-type with G patch domain n=1 Tax=Cyprinus carpio TaxID=7962 RepID=A0A8C2IEE2_CYPCA
MDESSLEEAIKSYSAPLQQVELALSAGLGSAEQADLLKLEEDLQQLIESSLVSVKKSQLLASLEEPSTNQNATFVTQETALEDEFAAFYAELSEDSEEEVDISGTKVCAPYRTSWGTLEYHNAMVVCPEEPEGEEARVWLLYLHPTNKCMKPCGFYLEGKCRFVDNCRCCLLRLQFFCLFVYFNKKEAVLEADGIIPPLHQDDGSSSSDSEDDTDQCDAAYAKGRKNNIFLNSLEYFPVSLFSLQLSPFLSILITVIHKTVFHYIPLRNFGDSFVFEGICFSLLSLSVFRDATVVSRIEEKLTASRKLLKQLKAQEQTIQREQKKPDTQKKMTEF